MKTGPQANIISWNQHQEELCASAARISTTQALPVQLRRNIVALAAKIHIAPGFYRKGGQPVLNEELLGQHGYIAQGDGEYPTRRPPQQLLLHRQRPGTLTKARLKLICSTRVL